MIDKKLADTKLSSFRGKRAPHPARSQGASFGSSNSKPDSINKRSLISKTSTVALRPGPQGSRVVAPRRPSRLRQSLLRGDLSELRPSNLTERPGQAGGSSLVNRNAEVRSSNPFKIKDNEREHLLRVSVAESIYNVQEFNEIVKYPFEDSKAAGNRPSALTGEPIGDEDDPARAQTSIFAVNSDVSFLYMIGKMCQESGHNLKLGL